MKKTILLGLILFWTFILSGCSSVRNFFIANNSDGILEVEIKWKDNLYTSPYKYQFESFNGEKVENLKSIEGGFTQEFIESAERDNVIRVSLETKQAVRIHSLINFEDESFNKKIDENFRVNYIKLTGKNGSVESSGEQIWYQFRQIGEDYFIIYR